MRAFHLTSVRWAVESIKHRRLKLSLIDEMNDPFELLEEKLPTPGKRRLYKKLKTTLNQTVGALCFSRSWSNPVLWSHYGDRHRGVALGFDIPDKWTHSVHYIERRTEGPNATSDTPAPMWLTTKFEHWRYEEEVRLLFALKNTEKVDSFYFAPYSEALQLREIVIGSCASQSTHEISDSVREFDPRIRVTRSRLAFHSFAIVPASETEA